MIGTAVFYTVDSAMEARDEFAPRMHGVTVEQAAVMDREQLVMWTTNERFAEGQRCPTPYSRFFYRGVEIINPWALFIGLPERPVREERPHGGSRRFAAARREDGPSVLDDGVSPDAARLFDAF